MDVCLITDSEPLSLAIQLSCLPPHTLQIHSWQEFLDNRNAVSEEGKEIARSASLSDIVLVGWSIEQAPLINALCYEIRSATFKAPPLAPIFAVYHGGQEDMVAAMAAGVDCVVHLPLYLPLLEAYITALHRRANAVRKNAYASFDSKIHVARARAEQEISSITDSLAGDILHLVRVDEQSPTDIPLAEKEKLQHFLQKKVVGEALDQTITSLKNEIYEADKVENNRPTLYELGRIRLNLLQHMAYIDDELMDLMPKEFSLLQYLIERGGQLCSREEILKGVWGINFETGTNMVDVYMHHLRKKLDSYNLKHIIQTVRGKGYRIVP